MTGRRRRTVSRLAPAALLVVLGWWLTRPAPAPAPAPEATAVVAAPRPAAAPGHEPEPPAPQPASTPAALGAVAATTASSAPTVLDLCGVGRLPAPAHEPGSERDPLGLPTPLGRDADDTVRPLLEAALQAQGPRGQAAALLLATDLLVDTGLRQRSAAALAVQARASGDPLLIHLALELCRWDGPGRDCGVSARDWVRVDPANAAAWLALAHDEPGARAEVLAGLQQARHHRLQYGAQTALMLQHWPAGQPEYLQLMQVVQIATMESVLSVGALTGATALRDLCPGGLAPGTAERQACDGVVRQMVEGGDTLAARGQGIALARRLGWPAEVVQAMQEEHDALTRVLPTWVVGDGQPYGCAATAARRRHVADVARLGEVGAARAARAAQAAGTPPGRERATAAGR
ncbi:MAG: hypothetical protein KF683_12400 [Rubrivivax sp.]|nr:hypothetical protein [Rubrivivax sp.]